ncbi:disease resistance protein RPV1 [Lactuca sativa]|uniref:disease resistance protein RPV1 n=1 Tax=Lactuca sativa TaxID=4236 RepID=UPI0022AED8BA|nr:disease resistance protein RPV1 [Lactuca sativa]XP_042758802.2 disease resistance protein RPV1 [Lactuca sativa]
MHGFPLKSIPLELPMENLVALDMSYSNIESFGIYYWYLQRFPKRLKQWIGSCLKDKRVLRSLKILNLSFCEQLRSLGGFDHLPVLEKLILRGCIRLLDVCESIEQCLELVFVDLSYCSKLQKVPRIIEMLKKVKTLFLDGCNLAVLEVIPNYSKFFTIYLPTSLVSLSLEDNNLFTESFPMDFSRLSMLKELYLDENPIVSLPNCVRSLPRLETLSMGNCTMLMSVEHPPHTLIYLNLFNISGKPMLQKVVFDPEMSPLQLVIDWDMLPPSSFEVEGMVKIQPMTSIEEKVLCSFCWTKPDFLNERHVVTLTSLRDNEKSEIQNLKIRTSVCLRALLLPHDSHPRRRIVNEERLPASTEPLKFD